MRIKVTAEHIANGVQADYQKCPIALAIVEQLGACELWVGCQSGHYRVDNLYQPFFLPDSAAVFVECFDRGGARAVEPFEFELVLRPDETWSADND